MSKVHEFQVEMTCGGCSGAVERVLGKLQGLGVEKVECDLDAQRVYVTTTMTAEEILAIIKKTGKSCSYIGEKQ